MYFSKLKWWQSSLLVILVMVIYVQIFGTIGTKILAPMIGWGGGAEPADAFRDTLQGRFARWDSGYYLQIARSGYKPGGSEIAFFPLYPVAIRYVSLLSGWPILWSGLLISVLCFLGSGLFLYKWAELEGDSQQAFYSVIWLCIFPMSFFFSSLYSESLFLLTSIATIYFTRRGQFTIAGLAMAFAGATRPTAFLLAIPYFLEFTKQHDYHWRRWLAFIVGALLAPLGLLSYLLFLVHQRGTLNVWSIYTATQAAEWKRSLVWPWITLRDGINAAVFGTNVNYDWFSRTEVWQDLLFALFALAFAVWGTKRFRSSISAYLLASVLFLFSNHGPYGYAFYSIPRYIAVLFPLYPLLASLTLSIPSRFRWLILIPPIILLGILSAWFATGRWVA